MTLTTARIVAAAIRHDGNVYKGARHATIMRELHARLGTIYITQEQQGFVTDTGVFVSRFEAGAIAFIAGQTTKRKTYLLSEDVW